MLAVHYGPPILFVGGQRNLGEQAGLLAAQLPSVDLVHEMRVGAAETAQRLQEALLAVSKRKVLKSGAIRIRRLAEFLI